MLRNCILAVILSASTATAFGQAPNPFGQWPAPQPAQSSSIEGQWYYRGDPQKPCYIQTINTPQGPMLLLTNENGSPSYGRLDRWGSVTAINWNDSALWRGNRIIWQDGNFWSR